LPRLPSVADRCRFAGLKDFNVGQKVFREFSEDREREEERRLDQIEREQRWKEEQKQRQDLHNFFGSSPTCRASGGRPIVGIAPRTR
jgi:hypothetical protein